VAGGKKRGRQRGSGKGAVVWWLTRTGIEHALANLGKEAFRRGGGELKKEHGKKNGMNRGGLFGRGIMTGGKKRDMKRGIPGS